MVDSANEPPPNNAGITLEKRKVGTIDLTPTWRSLIPVFVAVLQDGSANGRKIAIEELYRLADFADQVNAEKKGD